MVCSWFVEIALSHEWHGRGGDRVVAVDTVPDVNKASHTHVWLQCKLTPPKADSCTWLNGLGFSTHIVKFDITTTAGGIIKE